LVTRRVLNRLAVVAETLREAHNKLAIEEPQWLRSLAPSAWYAW
jgi:hypothetical protein